MENKAQGKTSLSTVARKRDAIHYRNRIKAAYVLLLPGNQVPAQKRQRRPKWGGCFATLSVGRKKKDGNGTGGNISDSTFSSKKCGELSYQRAELIGGGGRVCKTREVLGGVEQGGTRGKGKKQTPAHQTKGLGGTLKVADGKISLHERQKEGGGGP